MMTIMNPGKKVLGRDYNYFHKITVTATDFGDTADITLTFIPQYISFVLESGSAVEYSFNGNTVHGDQTSSTPSASLAFENRPTSLIWFRVASGSATIRVEAYGN